jgi:hypothetical protein
MEMVDLAHEVFIDEERQRWKDKVLRAKMLAMVDMGLNPLLNPKDLNARVKGKLIKAVEKLLEKPDKELEDEFNVWCCDEYFKSGKPVERLPCTLLSHPDLPPDLLEEMERRREIPDNIIIEEGICDACSS